MKTRYTRRALLDLAEIHDYSAADDPAAAGRVIAQIEREIQVLSVIHSARSWPTAF